MSALLTPAVQAPEEREIRVYSHSGLLYWWPVWVMGFVMALATYVGNHRMAVVPAGTVAVSQQQVPGFEGERDVLVVPAGKTLPPEDHDGAGVGPNQPHVLMATNKDLGMVFVATLLLVIFVTNVPLRGLWSILAVLALFTGSLALSLLGWWDPILRFFGLLHIYINAFGYLAIATCLFLAWVLTTFGFDRRTYMAFSSGQSRHHLEIGAGETAFDSWGMVVQKRQDDLFRHWILGMGSGDLVVKTGGAQPQTFELLNVLFVSRKLRMIEEMLQEREVIPAHK